MGRDNSNFYNQGSIGKGGRNKVKNSLNADPQPTVVRNQIDPETKTYFSEIANLFESSEIELEERSVICSNAIEEAKGKEFELATDYIISHTMQGLLEGSDVDHLCGFLRSCAGLFPMIATDRCGSHVAETALKSVATFVQENDYYSLLEDTLNSVCQGIAANPIDMMCNQHGSHVLRTLLCLCGGVRLDSPEFHGVKSSSALANRLNLQASRVGGSDSVHIHQGFPGLLKDIVSAMLKHTREDSRSILVDQCSSLVLQTALKLLAGDNEELLHVIPVLLGCKNQNLIDKTIARDIVKLMKEPAFSRLMELSSDKCGNFVVQALISYTRDEEQVKLIWKELGPKCKDLLEMGCSGVIASFVAASQRLQTHGLECCQALADAVRVGSDESPRFIIPRILFLENYFRCEDKSSWEWPNVSKMHVMGSLILQAVFKFPSDFIEPYIKSLTCMETEQILKVAKDAGGARVLEAFLDSDISAKHKRRVISKLKGHFGELAKNPSGCFTVEKCFTVSNLSLREAIASDLATVQQALEHSKAKQSLYLLRKLDIDGYAKRPDLWRSKQESRQATYDEFYAAFGKTEDATTHSRKRKKREEIVDHLPSEEHAKDVDSKGGKRVKKHKEKVESASDGPPKTPFLSEEMQGKKRKGKTGQLKAWK
ncbi:unnamed protein product [Linum tenue]|uniref:Pumilio homolog 23-like n=1 Tax=Linum tenue TaxID=586396 RepID=A0AAV0PKT1_9ROSI|nr:unnamed protein product [Linum tenue]